MELGITRSGLQGEDAPVEFQRELMVSRLKQALANGRAPRISSSELREDWLLLKKIEDTEQENISRKLEQANHPANQGSDWSTD